LHPSAKCFEVFSTNKWLNWDSFLSCAFCLTHILLT
jgi:hypothetical protein